MEFDYKLWVFVWTFIWSVLIGIFNWLLSTKLTGQAVKNVEKDFEEFKTQYAEDKKDRTDLLMQISKDIAYIKGKLENEDKIIKVLEKLIK